MKLSLDPLGQRRGGLARGALVAGVHRALHEAGGELAVLGRGPHGVDDRGQGGL